MRRRQFLQLSSAAAPLLTFPSLFAPRSLAAELPTQITDFSGLQLSAAIRSGQVSSVEVMRAYLSHIQRYNPVYNAIVGMADEDSLLSQAEQADRELARGDYRGWMHGMPHAVKDLSAASGLPHTSGSPLFADRIATEDSAFVARLRSAGAIFIGKTNSPEFGLGSQTYNPVFGPTGSAYDPELTSGGSSGGAASGLGTHMLPVADGSDMMGSLRNPGAFNNVIGFRPSAGFMSETEPQVRPLSTSGPMGRNTADTIQLLNTMAPRPFSDPFNALDFNGLRVGWFGDLDSYLALETGIMPLCEGNLLAIESAGAAVEPVMPRFDLDDLWLCWTTLRHSGRARMRPYYDDPETRSLLKPELIWEIEQSMVLGETDVRRANETRQDWYQEMDRLFNDYDFLVLPSAQVFPYSTQTTWPRHIGDRFMDTYHRWMEVVIPASVAGLPVVNVPVGFNNAGRPMGMQIIGRYGDDRGVLEFALAYEQITRHLARRPLLQEA